MGRPARQAGVRKICRARNVQIALSARASHSLVADRAVLGADGAVDVAREAPRRVLGLLKVKGKAKEAVQSAACAQQCVPKAANPTKQDDRT